MARYKSEVRKKLASLKSTCSSLISSIFSATLNSLRFLRRWEVRLMQIGHHHDPRHLGNGLAQFDALPNAHIEDLHRMHRLKKPPTQWGKTIHVIAGCCQLASCHLEGHQITDVYFFLNGQRSKHCIK